MIDRRRMPRQLTGLEGSVQVPLRPPMPAFITDISPNGAMIEIDRWDYVPAKFKLTLGDFVTQCTVRHRDQKYIGVAFATLYDMAHTGAPLTHEAAPAQDWPIQDLVRAWQGPGQGSGHGTGAPA
jgi:hypothetical protein